MKNNVILYDGICSLCNFSVRLILKKETGPDINFSPLDSKFSKIKIKELGIDESVDSIIFIKDNSVYYKSEAVFEISKFLKFPWKLLIIFKLLPQLLTDYIYDKIAKYRYRIFGKLDKCIIPENFDQNRFITD